MQLGQEVDVLLGESLPYITKYKLNKLARDINAEGEIYNKSLREVVEKYGEADPEGNMSVPKENPNYQKVAEIMGDIMNQEIELQYDGFPIEDFADLKAGHNFPVFSLLH